MISVLLLAVSLLAVVEAIPFPQDMLIRDIRSSIPSGFVLTGVPASDTLLDMQINLIHGNLSGLETALNEASSPSSSSYGTWLTREEVESYATPSQAAISTVTGWLAANGIAYRTVTPSGDWLAFSISVSQANQLFATEFSTFTHTDSGIDSIRTLNYSLPALLWEHVRLVYPTTSFSRPTRRPIVMTLPSQPPGHSNISRTASTTKKGSICSSSVTPACLQSLYNIPTAPAKSTSNSIGVTGFSDQFANKADLTSFLQQYRTDMSSSTSFGFTSVDGGSNPQRPYSGGVEANLDIQYTVGLATGVPVNFISVGSQYKDGADGGFLDVIQALLADPLPPTVLSTSYGLNTENDLSKPLTDALCNAYMQLTARGVSILFASGDGGVAATPGVPCSATFNPTFPTCPYVTLVGATQNYPETAAGLSAGGFSNYFAQPSWQSDAVSGYLGQIGNMYSGKFNRSGRAYPDVSAQGNNVPIILNGVHQAVAGTSCSSPIFASVIALLNDELLKAGKSVLGFLNPWLYANSWAFNDITIGSNPGCGTSGFPAKPGWDPVTGLGTPDYSKLRAAAGL